MTRPEPAWWAEARRLRAEGERAREQGGRPWTIAALAAHFDRAERTISVALSDAEGREREHAKAKARAARHKAMPGYVDRHRAANRRWRAKRKAARTAAE